MRILVIGAGPVGLMFCARLSQGGHDCVLIEQHRFDQTFSRASTLQPATLELLSELNCLSDLAPYAEVISEVMAWNLVKGTQRYSSYQMLSGCTRYPYRLHLPQSVLRERLLAELQNRSCCHLLEQSQAVAVHFDRHDQGVSVDVKFHGTSQLTETFYGDYLILCDGAHSELRQQLGLRFDGYDLPTPVVRLSVPEIPECLEEHLAGVSYLQSAKRSLSCLKMPDGWRFVLRPSLSEVMQAVADTNWARECLADFFADLVPSRRWSSLPAKCDSYRVAQRTVTTRRVKRVLVLGDAAHVTNTRGGLNMNFGLLEAYALASCFLTDVGLDGLDRWNCCWSGLTESALMARTTQLLHGRTPHFLIASNDERGSLMRSSLLDLLPSVF